MRASVARVRRLALGLRRRVISRLRDGLTRVLDPVFAPVEDRLFSLETVQRTHGRTIVDTRGRAVAEAERSIRVIFLCHQPAIWGKQRPVFDALRGDIRFDVSVVAMPFWHPRYGDEEPHDDGMAHFLRKSEGIEPIVGYSQSAGWIDLGPLDPDYVIYQTPYDSQLPMHLRSSVVSRFARVAYVPYYGILLYTGDVEKITHPAAFINNADLVFVAHQDEQQDFAARLEPANRTTKIAIVGSPMLDAIDLAGAPTGAHWPRRVDPSVKRVLWTPRWKTSEGNCHFFDYKEYFIELADSDEMLDVLLRPHPSMFDNFRSTGEFTMAEQHGFRRRVAERSNFGLDESGDYIDTMLASDVLVSDMSSMIVEYLAANKPVIYTHRTDTFNTFGRKLAEGIYWVRTQDELDAKLKLLLAGDDPLRDRRSELVETLFTRPSGGSANMITNVMAARILEPNAQASRS